MLLLRQIVGRVHQTLAPNAHIGALEGASGARSGTKPWATGGFAILPSTFEPTPLPRRIARYPRRHPGHHLGRRRDGLCYGVRGRDARGKEIVVEQSGLIRIGTAREVTMPDRDMVNLGRGRLVADACKGARIPRERREAPNPRYLLGAG